MAAQQPVSESGADPAKVLSSEVDKLPEDDPNDEITEFISTVKERDQVKTLQALKKMSEMLSITYSPEDLEGRVPEISSLLAGIIQSKDKDGICWAAKVAALMYVQCNEKDEYDTYIKLHRALLSSASHVMARSASDAEMYVNALGICGFIFTTPEIVTDIRDLYIDQADAILRSDSKANPLSPEKSSLCCTLLRSIGLLLIASSSKLLNSIEGWSWLRPFLESSNVNISITAGEVVMLLYEILYCIPMDEDLEELSQECLKIASKPNKRLSRSDQHKQTTAFNNIAQTLAGRSAIYMEIRIGSEKLYVDTYAALIKYTGFRHLLTHGMYNQMKENKFLRRILTHNSAALKKAAKLVYAKRSKARSKQRREERISKSRERDPGTDDYNNDDE